MACKVSLQSLLATLIAISVANNGNGSAQVAGRCIAVLTYLDDLITLHQRKRLSIRQRSPVWS